MVDISITAASVLPSANPVFEDGIAGVAITAGQLVYRDASTGKYLLADADSATAAAREPRGVALNGASDGQPLRIQRSGDVTIGGTLTAGVTYYLSNTPGGICPIADVGSGEYYCAVGIARSASVLRLGFLYSGVSA